MVMHSVGHSPTQTPHSMQSSGLASFAMPSTISRAPLGQASTQVSQPHQSASLTTGYAMISIPSICNRSPSMRPDKERFADDSAKQARFTRLRQNIRQAAERRRQLPSGATERDLGILELGKQAETSQKHVIPPVTGRPCKPNPSTRMLECTHTKRKPHYAASFEKQLCKAEFTSGLQQRQPLPAWSSFPLPCPLQQPLPEVRERRLPEPLLPSGPGR